MHLYKAVLTKYVKGSQTFEIIVEAEDKIAAASMIEDDENLKSKLKTAEDYEVTGIKIVHFGTHTPDNSHLN